MKQQNIARLREKCNQVVARAKELYPHLASQLDHVQVRLDLTGRCAGYAMRRMNNYSVRFNIEMLGREAAEHVINDTVPHEYAHIVCFMDPRLGNNHDYGWKRVCIALGGSGERCHNEEVVMGKGNTYEYLTSAGHKVRVGERHHARIQNGETFTWRQGKGKVVGFQEYEIVAVSGRVLETPIKRAGRAKPVTTAPVDRIQQYLDENRDKVESIDPKKIELIPPVPKQVVAPKPTVAPVAGVSKATQVRNIMSAGYRAGKTYETIIAEMMAVTGWPRQQARATFKNNMAKAGIPTTFC